MDYSQEIKKAYNNWMQKVSEVPESYSVDYPKKKRAESRAGNKFEKLCAANGLNYIKVASELVPNTIFVYQSKKINK